MARTRKRRMMNQINVVPYIDVTLVLLVIFMVTAPMTNPGVVDLPKVGQALNQHQVPPVAVSYTHLDVYKRQVGPRALVWPARPG